MAFLVEDGIRDGSVYFHSTDGFSFHYNRVMRGGRVSFRCIHYKRLKCRGRASIGPDGENFRHGVVLHNHDKDWNILHMRRFRSAVLKACRQEENGRFSLKTIFHNVRRSMRCVSLVLPLVKIICR